MINLTVIIHTDDRQNLIFQLRAMEQVAGFTTHHAEGHGIEKEQDAFLSSRDNMVGSVPRIRCDIVLHRNNLDAVLEMIRCERERGALSAVYYWVTAVDQEGYL